MNQNERLLYIKQVEDGFILHHNQYLDKEKAFYFNRRITEDEAWIINLAIKEGERRKAVEIREALLLHR